MTKTHSEFIEDARRVHGAKYEYIGKYVNSLTKISISCPVHGIFNQKPKHHLVGKGCSKCGTTSTKTLEKFLEEAHLIHGNKYIYPEKYVNDKSKINIICPYHGLFSQRPTSHIHSKQGCSKCSSKGTSIAANKWLKSLNIPGLQTFESSGGEYRIPGLKYKVDGYDKNTNTVYEYHGCYWHGHPTHKDYKGDSMHPTIKLSWNDLYKKTIERDRKIMELGYNLIVAWESAKNNTK